MDRPSRRTAPDTGFAHPADEPVPGWSPALLHTLAAAFDTLASMPAETARRRAHLAAETLDAVADPDELRLLKLAVRSLDWPPALLATAGHWGRFSSLDRAAREAVLLAWARHPVGRLRTAFQAIKRLGLFLAYADAGEDEAGNPAWSRIGYRPPSPVGAPPPSIEPLRAEALPGSEPALEADVVVVGSGAGGGVVAARLAEAGRSVLVIEAGPYLPEAKMPTLEARAMQQLYLDQGTTATADLSVTVLAGTGLGGGTTINWTTAIAPPDWLRDEWEREHGLEGLAGGATDEILARLRGELDLRPPSVIPPKDRVILDGAAALGWEAAPTERNAGPCVDCGACGFGCRAGAKRSGLRAHLAMAARAGARVLVDARVERIEIAGGRVRGIRGTLREGDGRSRPFHVAAPQVVVAAGALRTPLLLHASGIAHPQLGRNLRLHPVVAVGAEMPDPVHMWLGPTQAARSLQFWRPGAPDRDGIGPAHGGFVIESAPPHPGLLASAFAWEDAAAAAARMDRAAYLVPLIGIIRDRGSGHVHWTRHRRARIDYRLSAADGQTARRAMVELARLARAGGAREVFGVANRVEQYRSASGDAAFDAFLRRLARTPVGPNRVALFSAHQMGTARAGADPVTHPVDPWGWVRAGSDGKTVRGLAVADASLFPGGSGVNPMLTVMVLADRVAESVLSAT